MKENKMRVYRVFRTILGPIYKFWYNPKIIGKENIPKEGPILVVGNHVHIMDQCNVIASTKRKIHYMAKKEYFDPQYPEGHHGWFFRSAGCIPVDRKIHDDEAKGAALEVLNGGHSLGLFPEGTRNGLKEERIHELYAKYHKEGEDLDDFECKVKKDKASQINYLEELIEDKVITKEDMIEHINDTDSYLRELIDKKIITKEDYYEHYLLPFKFGAVSMAQKTGAFLVPFVMTGTYKFRSKDLVVRIGKPFQVKEGENLEDANKKLRKIMLDLIKENKNEK
ncbi:MAG: 1-acyl-sn-glycerol-3-phosphate acyltransferase [Bacilli bacterium]|nr:1-acyl-sn-glycerol-3-phosphate acyltransferase [Bacilli bacterium]